MSFIQEYWEGLVALLALIVSISSTAIAYYTFKLQRTHNIKSVKPILHIGQWDYENRIYVTLKNVGYGIAVIKKMNIYDVKGESKTCIYDWLPNSLPGDMNYKEYWTPYAEFVVQAGETIKLIEIPIDTSKSKQIKTREKLRKMLGQLTVEVTCKDVYENEMPIKRLQLTHFLRLDNEN
ncbi:hypothetical protein [Maribacter sp. 2308TA10-17]|uniref:hypothetical protein n=1 Tax=Maribacter sp. 2308TA10-17 TaxID=3386276 RepID=UPI0039BCEB69